MFFLSHSEPRIRYDAMDCIAQLTDDFEELGDAAGMFLQGMLQMQETVIPVLLHRTIAISQLVDVMDEEELIDYKEQLLSVAVDSINANFAAD